MINPQLVAEVHTRAGNGKHKWGEFNSAHEGFAVLKEEVDELWDIVKTKQKDRDLNQMQSEALDVAAMALRFAEECCSEEKGRK